MSHRAAEVLVTAFALAAVGGACAPHALGFGKPCTVGAAGTEGCDDGYSCVSGLCLPTAAAEGEGEGEGEGEPASRGPTLSGTTVVILLADRSRTVHGRVLATDPNSDPLSYTLVSAPDGVTIALDATTGTFEATSTLVDAAEVTATVEVSDGANTDRADIAILVVAFAPEENVAGLWTGAASDNVADVANWTPAQVPSPSMDVFIPFDAPHMPALAQDAVWRGLYVENDAFIEAGTRTVVVQGDGARPCFVGGEVRSSALQDGLRISNARMGGVFPAVSTTGTVEAAKPTIVANLVVDSEGNGFAANAPVYVSGDFSLSGFSRAFSTNARIVVEGDVELNPRAGFDLSGGELRVRGDLFIRSAVAIAAGHRIVLDGAAPQRLATATDLVDVVVAGTVSLTNIAELQPRLRVFNTLTIEDGGSLFVPDDMTLTMLPDASLSLSPGGSLSGSLVELGGPISAGADASYGMALTRLVSGSGVVPWPSAVEPLDVEVGASTNVALASPGVMRGALNLFGHVDLAGQTLTVDTLTVGSNGTLGMQDPDSVVSVQGGAVIAGPNPEAFMAAGVLRIGGDLSLSSPSPVFTFGGPQFTYELTAASTVTLDGAQACELLTLNNCGVPNLDIGASAVVDVPPLFAVQHLLHVDGRMVFDTNTVVVAGDLELAEGAELVAGDCPSVTILAHPATAEERLTCTLYIAPGGRCLDDTGLYGCP